jgi:hypothetical protein
MILLIKMKEVMGMIGDAIGKIKSEITYREAEIRELDRFSFLEPSYNMNLLDVETMNSITSNANVRKFYQLSKK